MPSYGRSLAPSPPPTSPETGGQYLNGTTRVAGILGGALGSLLFLSMLLWFALCRPKRDANPDCGYPVRRGFGSGSESKWEHEPKSLSRRDQHRDRGARPAGAHIATDPVIWRPGARGRARARTALVAGRHRRGWDFSGHGGTYMCLCGGRPGPKRCRRLECLLNKHCLKVEKNEHQRWWQILAPV